MRITYDKKADAIYIYFSDAPVAYTKELGLERYMDYDNQNTPVGIEFLCVSRGVTIEELPHADIIASMLAKKKIKVFAQ